MVGCCEYFFVFGSDYLIKDGIGVCDYIYVMDLVDGYIVVLKKVGICVGLYIYNLGMGKGYSVLDVVKVFEIVLGCIVFYKLVDCCLGDIVEYWVDFMKVV